MTTAITANLTDMAYEEENSAGMPIHLQFVTGATEQGAVIETQPRVIGQNPLDYGAMFNEFAKNVMTNSGQVESDSPDREAQIQEAIAVKDSDLAAHAASIDTGNARFV